MRAIRVVVTGMLPIVAQGVNRILSTVKDLVFLGECPEGRGGKAFLKRTRPDVVVTGAPKHLRELGRRISLSQVLVLAEPLTEEGVYAALAAGVGGCLSTAATVAEILAAVRTVAAGGRAVPEAVQALLEARCRRPELSPRERETLQFAAEGLSVKEIGARLGVSEHGAKIHLRHLYEKLDVSDRTAAILKGGADPMPELIRSARRLEAAGADFLCMSCNTAHYFHERLSKEVSIPILNMPAESARELKRRGIRKVGLLATDGTIRTGVYHRYLKAEGIEVIVPEGENQTVIMSLIYDCVKKNAPTKDYPAAAVAKTVADLKARGAEAYLLACTELPIAFERLGYKDGFIDPTLVLARAVIRDAGAPLKR